MHHDRWDHNVMVPGVFKEFAAEIDAKIAENVADAKYEIAKKMKARNTSIKEIAEITGLSEFEVKAL